MAVKDLLSQRVKDIEPSGIRKFFDLASQVEDVVSLGVGEPDFDTPWRVSDEAIYAIQSGRTTYTENSGLLKLRQEICHYVKRHYYFDYDATSECIVTVGGSEAIDLCYRSFINPGDEVIIPVPTYVAYAPGVTLSGGVIKELKLSGDNQFKVTPQALEALITPKSKMLIMNYPSNPTGGTMSYDDYALLVPIIKKHHLIVVSDEIYSELIYDNSSHYSLANFDEIKDQVLVINGFSKAFAMTGWRLGYILGNKEIIANMLKIHQYTIMCAPIMAQYAGIEALKHCDEEVAKMRSAYQARRNLIVKGFNDLGLPTHKPKGAFYIFPDITSTGLSSEAFCEELLAKQKVACVPGTAFGAAGEGYIRVSYAYSLEELNAALKRIKCFLEDIKK